MRIFVINPGATSTKIAIFEEETAVFSKTITHDADALAPFSSLGGSPFCVFCWFLLQVSLPARYFASRVAKRCRIAAASARVALFVGFRRLLVSP